MSVIGIMTINAEKNSTLDSLIRSNGYSVSEMSHIKQVDGIDSLLIVSENQPDLNQMCEWIIAMQGKKKGFVWIFYPKCSNQEREIFLQLGVNGIVDQAERIGEMAYLIKNALIKGSSSIFPNEQKEEQFKLLMKESNFSVTLDGEREVLLTRLEYQLMALMYKEVNTAVTYGMFADHLWRNSSEGDQKYRVANLVYHLREKLGKNGNSLIQTVRTKGYRLNL